MYVNHGHQSIHNSNIICKFSYVCLNWRVKHCGLIVIAKYSNHDLEITRFDHFGVPSFLGFQSQDSICQFATQTLASLENNPATFLGRRELIICLTMTRIA